MAASDAQPSPPRGTRRSALLVAVLVAVVAGVCTYAMMVVDRARVLHDLRLTAPRSAAAGTSIPVRAFVFDEIEEPWGPRIATDASIDVALVDASGAAGPTLALAAVEGYAAGSLAIPASASGEQRLVAVARVGGSVVARTELPLAIGEPARIARTQRSAHATQQLAVEALRPEAGHAPPPRLDVWIRGGACVPEEPCELVFDVGAPGFWVAIGEQRARASDAAPHLASLEHTVHGPEGELEVVVHDDAGPAARAGVRLAIALATPWLRVEPDGRLRVRPPPGRELVVLDAFRDDAWVATATLTGDALSGEPLALPFALPEGLHRLQARADPLGGERVMVAWVGSSPEQSLRLLADEEDVLVVPAAVTGYDAEVQRLATLRARVQLVAVCALILAIVLISVVVLRRGLDAAAEARALMVEAGDPEADSVRARRRSILGVVLIVAGIGLALATGAVLVLVRGAIVDPTLEALGGP